MALTLPERGVKFFLHIPRTGGTARQSALINDDVARHPETGTCYFAGHGRYMSDVRQQDTPVIFLRDPLQRFVSAWEHIWRKNRIIYEWRSIEELALDLPHAEPKISKRIPIFMPQARWFDSERPDVLVGYTESMAGDIDTIMGRHVTLPSLTHPTANASKDRGVTLSVNGAMHVLDYYAEDIDLIASFQGRKNVG